MNFFSIAWMKFVDLFRQGNFTPLDPVVVPVAEPVVLELLPEIVLEVEPPKVLVHRKQLTKNFHIDEFECHDGTAVPHDLYGNVLELAENLQVLRDALNLPIKIVSGYRHLEYNKKIGGARKSQHMLAKAADIKVKGIGPKRLADTIEAMISEGDLKKGGVGRYPTFTHYDVRGKNARWGGTRKKN